MASGKFLTRVISCKTIGSTPAWPCSGPRTPASGPECHALGRFRPEPDRTPRGHPAPQTAAGSFGKFMSRNMKGTSRCYRSNFDKRKNLFSICPSGVVLEHHDFGHQETYPPERLPGPINFPSRKPHSELGRSQRHTAWTAEGTDRDLGGSVRRRFGFRFP